MNDKRNYQFESHLEERSLVLKENSQIQSIYKVLSNIINEEICQSLWNLNNKDVDNQEEYEAIYNEDHLKESCFLEIVEMTNLEKELLNLESLNHKSLKYKTKKIVIRIRKYKNYFLEKIFQNTIG